MSDLAATNCGCASNDNGCSWIIILLLLCCCTGRADGADGVADPAGFQLLRRLWRRQLLQLHHLDHTYSLLLRMRFLKHCITKPFHSPITITKSMLCTAGEG